MGDDFLLYELIVVCDELVELFEYNEEVSEIISTYFQKKYGINKKDEDDEYD